MKKIIVLASVFVSFFLMGCDEDTTYASLELNGIWEYETSGATINITFTNNAFTWTINGGSTIYSGEIVSFDNEANVLIALYNTHSNTDFVGKYAKTTWTPDSPSTTATFTVYLYADNASIAEDESTILEGYPATATKQ